MPRGISTGPTGFAEFAELLLGSRRTPRSGANSRIGQRREPIDSCRFTALSDQAVLSGLRSRPVRRLPSARCPPWPRWLLLRGAALGGAQPAQELGQRPTLAV